MDPTYIFILTAVKLYITKENWKPAFIVVGKEGDIKFSRHAYSFLDLKGTDEFLVSQGVPYKNTKLHGLQIRCKYCYQRFFHGHEWGKHLFRKKSYLIIVMTR